MSEFMKSRIVRTDVNGCLLKNYRAVVTRLAVGILNVLDYYGKSARLLSLNPILTTALSLSRNLGSIKNERQVTTIL